MRAWRNFQDVSRYVLDVPAGPHGVAGDILSGRQSPPIQGRGTPDGPSSKAGWMGSYRTMEERSAELDRIA